MKNKAFQFLIIFLIHETPVQALNKDHHFKAHIPIAAMVGNHK
jgi:hypothetical protein